MDTASNEGNLFVELLTLGNNQTMVWIYEHGCSLWNCSR